MPCGGLGMLLLQCQTEVNKKRLILVPQKNVARLDITVDDTARVCVVQRFRNRCDQLHRLVDHQRRLANSRLEVAAFDQFGHDVERKLRRATHIVHGHDVWMVEACHRSSFGKLYLCYLTAFEELHMRDFDRHWPVELFIVSRVDHSKATFAERTRDLISADALWCLQQSISGVSRFVNPTVVAAVGL